MATSVHEAEQSADALLRQAHARAYRYPAEFKGFRAELTWRVDERSGAGGAVASPGPEIELGLDAPESDRAWVERELRSIVAHRQASAYDERDGRHAKRTVDHGAHPLGTLVELVDEYGSSYRVAGDQLSAVTRSIGDRRFTIVVHERAVMPDGTGLPTSFTVFYWNAESGRLSATEAYRDAAVEVDGVYLPQSREIVRGDDEGLSVRSLALTGHELLEGSDR
jgi:Protein of unknown function (DUF3386)